jgi:UDP-glucose 4-epimerase
VIHLAAVSRVVWGERDPVLCRETNVNGTKNVVGAAASSSNKPWVLFSSSREIYGEPQRLPVHESDDFGALNVYGITKVEGEKLVMEGREHGLSTAVMRLSNVYGTTTDHVDRVVPAFARAAALGTEMRVDGRLHTFDFTHLDDTVRGIVSLVNQIHSGERRLPPIHFVTGSGTTLGGLAEIASKAGGRELTMREAAARDYDVNKFVGNPLRAREILGWNATIGISEGVHRLVQQFMTENDEKTSSVE